MFNLTDPDLAVVGLRISPLFLRHDLRTRFAALGMPGAAGESDLGQFGFLEYTRTTGAAGVGFPLTGAADCGVGCLELAAKAVCWT